MGYNVNIESFDGWSFNIVSKGANELASCWLNGFYLFIFFYRHNKILTYDITFMIIALYHKIMTSIVFLCKGFKP